MTRVVAIVQARMTSTRLPGKVLRDLCGRPMLSHVVTRLRACRLVDDIVIATSDRPTDDPVVAFARTAGVRSFRGSETDVLSRYADAAREADADVVVRITADCPLLDPDTVDRVVEALGPSVDYAANVVRRTFPRGLDAEALHRDVLERIARMARSQHAREHVTQLVHSSRSLFRVRSVEAEQDHSDLRWTVDTAKDFAMVSGLCDALGLATRLVPYLVAVDYVRANPSLAAINADVHQKTVPADAA